MSISIKLATTSKDIQAIADLAAEIWLDHYTPILGKSQVDYMLDKFQSCKAIENQIAEGQNYYLIEVEKEYAGYVSLIHDIESNSMMISKIYTRSSSRGKGIGHSILEFVENECATKKVSRLWLTVNKNNLNSISWYQRRGFEITEESNVDIGSDFYMDDYIMEKPVGSFA